MLHIKTNKGWFPLENRQKFSIETTYEGDQLLAFDIATNDDYAKYIKEEANLLFEDNIYTIKNINRRKHLISVTAEIDMWEWKVKPYSAFKQEDKLFSEIIDFIKPYGWIIENSGSIAYHASFDLKGVTPYDILMDCIKKYNIVYEYHSKQKIIKVIHPDSILPRGLYMTDELNLTDIEYKGSSDNLITLLQAHGKKSEIKDDNGNVIAVEYVTFKELNDGKDYIENHSYTDKVIAGYWQDDSYSDPQQLYDDAVEKLKALAIPVKSYSCKLFDLSRTNEEYKMLDFHMYDKPMLIDASGIHEQHQVVKYKRYPDQERDNEIVLSTSFQKISGKIEHLTSQIDNIDNNIHQQSTILNEVVRDVDVNAARIENTYTKGETDFTITSVVQQAKDELNVSIQSIEKDTKNLEVRVDNTEQQITPEQITNTVSSQFYKKDETDLMYSSKEEVSSQISQLQDSINITLKEISGSNLLYNSSGWNATNFWYGKKSENGSFQGVDGDIIGIKNNDTSDHTISGSAFLCKAGMMCQDVRLMPNKTYTFSCLAKRSLSACSCKIIQSDKELEVFQFDDTYTDEDWHRYEITFACLSSPITIEIQSSADYLMIADMMLNDGEIAKTWTSNNDEIYAGNVKIDSDGIRISQSDTDTQTIIDSTEFAVVYGKTGKKVVRVNKDTTVLQKVVAEDDLTIGTVKMIKRENGLDIAIIEEQEG